MIVVADSRRFPTRSSRFAVSIFPVVRTTRLAQFAKLVALAASAVALQAGCWRSAQSGGIDAGIDIVTGAGGAAMGAGGMMMDAAAATDGPVLPTASCDAIGTAPVLPAMTCATIMATKTVTNGIPTDESTLDTMPIQAALDTCPAGQAVRLVTDGDNVAFLTGGLFLRSDVTLWVDDGVTIFGSRDPRDFDGVPGSGKCGLMGGNSDCNALINVVGATNAALMGTGTLDGRGGELMIGGTMNWWDLENVDQGNLVAPRMVWVRPGNGFVLSGVTLKNAPKFHVVIERTIGFTVWGITINTPANSVNTDGVDPSSSTNGIIAYNKITTGDDNIAIKGVGAADGQQHRHRPQPLRSRTRHVDRQRDQRRRAERRGLRPDASTARRTGCASSRTPAAAASSSRSATPTSASATASDPLVFDSYYSSATGALIPWFKDITIRNVHSLTGGKLIFRGWDAAHTQALTLDNVILDTAPSSINASNVAFNFGPNPVTNIAPTGTTNVTVNKAITGTARSPRLHERLGHVLSVWVTFLRIASLPIPSPRLRGEG